MSYPRIRELRERHGLSQARVGSLINFPQRTYAYYEAGKRMLPPEVICALARLYNVTADYILELSDEAGGRGKNGEGAAFALPAGTRIEF